MPRTAPHGTPAATSAVVQSSRGRAQEHRRDGCAQCIVVHHACRVGREPRVARQRDEPGDAAEAGELQVVADGQEEVAVGSAERVVRRDRRMAVAEPPRHHPGIQKGGRLVAEERHHRIHHRHVDVLAGAAALARKQCQQDALHRHQPGHQVGNGHAHPERRAVLRPGDAHQATLGLQHRVVTRFVPPGAGLAEARDGAVNQPRPLRPERLIVEAGPCEGARTKVLDQDVGAVDQPAEQRPALSRLEVERDALLVAVDAEEIGTLPADERRSPGASVVPTPGLLNLDDAGAHVGEQHRAIRAGQHPGQVDHGQSVKWPGHAGKL